MQSQIPHAINEGRRCNAKTRGGAPCRSWAMPAGRCRMHGGKSPGGIASPRFKTGRYSRYLPARVLDRGLALLDNRAAAPILALYKTLARSVERHVTDPAALAAIDADLDRFLARYDA